MKKLKLALVTMALAGSSLAMAQDKAALIQQYIDMQRPSIEAMARGLVERASAPIAAAGSQYLQTQVPPEKREDALKAANAELKKYFDDAFPIVRDKAVELAPSTLSPIMEQNFSEDELKQLLAWYSSPLSKKYAEIGPKLEAALVEKLVAETRPTVEPKLVALDNSVAKVLGAPTKPIAGTAGAAAPAKAPAKK